MKLWYTIFILAFMVVYGTLSFALLGSWAYERVTSRGLVRYLQHRKGGGSSE